VSDDGHIGVYEWDHETITFWRNGAYDPPATARIGRDGPLPRSGII
jgi:hypothetical protein